MKMWIDKLYEYDEETGEYHAKHHPFTSPNPEDLDRLLGLINEHTPFPLAKDSLLTGTHGQYTPAIGAALFYVKNFLDT